MTPHWFFILYLFIVGSCVGSFLNVVIHRLPRGDSLFWPPSHCPHCNHRIAWYDNLPILSWILLRAKCRNCGKPISIRYPIVEAITGLLFVFYYVMFFMLHIGPCRDPAYLRSAIFLLGPDSATPPNYWPIYALDMLLLSGLLAASLIDAELYIIPAVIPWVTALLAAVGHAIFDRPDLPGSLLAAPASLALSAGAGIGLAISILLLHFQIIPLSFPEGDLLESEREDLHLQAKEAKDRGDEAPEIPDELTPKQIRAEMRKEMLFLIPPLLLGGISLAMQMHLPAVHDFWRSVARHFWINGLLASLLGAMVGAFVVWLTRILGSYAFGREAMGLGDVHLMFGVGAVLGGGAATVAFFLAPFFGIVVAFYMLFTGTRRQLPYGPYLSLATALVMLFYCPIADQLRPGLYALIHMIRSIAA
jgi:leader peptidase (prepilin peptidase) / N-methyltransferase